MIVQVTINTIIKFQKKKLYFIILKIRKNI